MTVLRSGACAVVAFTRPVLSEAVLAELAACLARTRRRPHRGVRRGLVTGWGGTVRLPTAAGAALASRTLVAGTPISGRELAARGVAVAAAGDVVEAALAVAARIAAVPDTRLLLWRALRPSRSPWPAAARAIIGSAAVP